MMLFTVYFTFFTILRSLHNLDDLCIVLLITCVLLAINTGLCALITMFLSLVMINFRIIYPKYLRLALWIPEIHWPLEFPMLSSNLEVSSVEEVVEKPHSCHYCQ